MPSRRSIDQSCVDQDSIMKGEEKEQRGLSVAIIMSVYFGILRALCNYCKRSETEIRGWKNDENNMTQLDI